MYSLVTHTEKQTPRDAVFNFIMHHLIDAYSGKDFEVMVQETRIALDKAFDKLGNKKERGAKGGEEDDDDDEEEEPATHQRCSGPCALWLPMAKFGSRVRKSDQVRVYYPTCNGCYELNRAPRKTKEEVKLAKDAADRHKARMLLHDLQRCSCCTETYFSHHFNSTGPQCKFCIRENRKHHRNRFKTLVNWLKARHACADSTLGWEGGLPRCNGYLEFDHRRDTKLFAISDKREGRRVARSQGRPFWIVFVEEIMKCDLVCSLHHLYRTYACWKEPGSKTGMRKEKQEFVNAMKRHIGACQSCGLVILDEPQFLMHMEFDNVDPTRGGKDGEHVKISVMVEDSQKTVVDIFKEVRDGPCMLRCKGCHQDQHRGHTHDEHDEEEQCAMRDAMKVNALLERFVEEEKQFLQEKENHTPKKNALKRKASKPEVEPKPKQEPEPEVWRNRIKSRRKGGAGGGGKQV